MDKKAVKPWPHYHKNKSDKENLCIKSIIAAFFIQMKYYIKSVC